MKRELFLSKIDKRFILEILSQEHKELMTKYQILATSILSFSIGFAVTYATNQIQTEYPFNMVIFCLSYGILEFFGLTFIFENYFKSLKEKILNIGEDV